MTDTGRTLHSLAMPSSGAATGTPTTTPGCSTSTTTGLTTTTTTLDSADPSSQYLDAGHAATEGSILVEGIPQDPAKARQKAKPKTAAAPPGAVVLIMLTAANNQAYIPSTAQKNAVRFGSLSKAVNSRKVSSNAAFVRLASPMGGLDGEPKGSLIRFLSLPTRPVPPTILEDGVRLTNLNESEQIMLEDVLSHQEYRVINRALKIFERKFSSEQISLTNQDSVKSYLQLRLGALEHEEFHVLWLDTQNKLIACEMLFTGTLTQTQVHPREVIKSALKHNAASAIFSHNHPTGVCKESQSDIMLTKELKKILLQIEVRLLDHIIVTPLSASSMLEKGII